MPFNSEGTLVTDQREIAISDTWETQTEWEAYQSKADIKISNGTLSLTEFQGLSVEMFSDPQYQFYAGSIGANDGDTSIQYPEILSTNSSATAVGQPIFRENKNSQYDTVEYNGNDEGHDWTGQDGSVSGNSWSISALVWINSGANSQSVILKWANARFDIVSSSNLSVQINGSGDPGQYGSVTQGQFITVGVSFSSGEYRFYLNGSDIGGESSGTPNSMDNSDLHLAYDPNNSGTSFDGFITEIVVSNTQEPATTFSDYHTNRLP